MLKRPILIDIGISATLLLAAIIVAVQPVQKSEAAVKIDLSRLVPESFDPWVSRSFDTSGYADQWQSINSLLVREYAKPNLFSFSSPATQVAFILEYSSDLRQNFSFHFPENCHRAGGNEVQFLSPAKIDLGDGKILMARRLFIKGQPTSREPIDKIVTYWLVMDGKQYYKTLFIKLDQMLSGLLSKAKSGYLIRVDYYQGFEYSPEGIVKADKVTGEFIKNLYESLPVASREKIFGNELA